MPSVLLIDRAARGHALADVFVRTNQDVVVHYAPGSAAISHPRILCHPDYTIPDHESLLRLAEGIRPDFVLIANVYALLAGCADLLRRHGHVVIGPGQEASRLEASKVFTKNFCARHGIPQAGFRCFDDPGEAKTYVTAVPFRVVVKADGLAYGNGVFVCGTVKEAFDAIDFLLVERPFGSACDQIVVEERLPGVEFSYFGIFDGDTFLALPMAMDYPKSGDGDTGYTCAGVGSVSPHPLDSPHLRDLVESRIVHPMIEGIRSEKLDYRGPIYFGCMLAEEQVYLLEVNVRLGDPESQAIFPRIQSDFYATCVLAAKAKLAQASIAVDSFFHCAVTAYQGPTERIVDGRLGGMTQGWPSDDYVTGHKISGLEHVDIATATPYFATVLATPEHEFLTASNRPITIVGHGPTLVEARANAYRSISKVHFDGMTYRNDIGLDFPRMK